MQKESFFRRAWNLYTEGFKQMGWVGKRMWIIIFLKLFVMFAILKMFFFPNFLNTNFDTDQAKAEHVLEQLTTDIPLKNN